MSGLTATHPQKLGPARAERLGRHMYADADAVEYVNKPGRGEILVVREGNRVRLIDYRNLDNRGGARLTTPSQNGDGPQGDPHAA